MKRLILPLSILAMTVGAIPAQAEKIDFSTMKCRDFIAASKDDIGVILIWLEGFYTKADSEAVLDTDKMMADAKSLGEFCQANPDKDIITAADGVVTVR